MINNLYVLLIMITGGFHLQVFEFINNQNNEISELSMKDSIELDQVIMICSSHKQMQANKYSSSIFTLYEDKDMKTPWIFLGFWIKADLWINVKTYTWYLVEEVPFTKFRNWVHLCIRIDKMKKTLAVSIDGEMTKEIGNVTALTALERAYLV